MQLRPEAALLVRGRGPGIEVALLLRRRRLADEVEGSYTEELAA